MFCIWLIKIVSENINLAYCWWFFISVIAYLVFISYPWNLELYRKKKNHEFTLRGTCTLESDNLLASHSSRSVKAISSQSGRSLFERAVGKAVQYFCYVYVLGSDVRTGTEVVFFSSSSLQWICRGARCTVLNFCAIIKIVSIWNT